jgi:autotransporter passenger strand-loop-strand repeat protein
MTVIAPANGVTLHNGDTMDVTDAASVNDTTIETGGLQSVGGSEGTSTATNSVINGGEQDVVIDGVASYTTINMGGRQHITGEYVHEGPNPGAADHTTINNGGEQDVDTGIATTTTVNSGGVQNVTNGGSASGTIVNSGGKLTVSGETVEQAPVFPEPVIQSVATAATINYGAELDITGGGTAVNAIVDGGVMTVSGSIPDPFANVRGANAPAVDPSMATGTTLKGGGKLTVSDGGELEGTTVGEFSTLTVDAGGKAINTTVNSYGVLYLYGDAASSGLVLNSGSTLVIGDGAVESGFTVANGVTLGVYSGSMVENSVVASGGTLILEAGAVKTNTVFQSGATFIADYGYEEDGFTVSNGVVFKVFGVATDTTISAGGTQSVGQFDEGGVATNTVINGGEQDVWLSSVVSYTTIDMGGIQRVEGVYIHDEPGPGRADHTTVNDGGVQDVDGGIVTVTTINAGGIQNVTAGGDVSGDVIESDGVVNVSGETVYHSPGGEFADVIRSQVDGTIVGSGAALHLSGAGIASNSTINGGVMTVSGSIPDPVPSNPYYNSPAVDASSATNTILNSGSLSVSDGGIVTSTTLNGGTLDVLNEGTANATTIHLGATELVESSGVIGATTIAGGSLDLKAGAISDDAITFSGQGTLEIEQKVLSGTSTFASQIKGIALGDSIDLSGLSYMGGATASVSGSILTVSNGAASESFTLANTLVTHFGITKDSSGGILLTAAAALPIIAGAVSGQETSNEASINPFAAVAITDPNAGAMDSLTITLAGAGGILSGTGLISLGNGTYELAATTAADLTTELHNLTFTATQHGDNSATTTFTLSDTSSVGLTVSDASTSVTDIHQAAPDTIDGPTSGYAIIQGTTGDDIINAFGMFNTIHGNGGNDTVYAGLYGTVDLPSGNGTVHLQGIVNHVTAGNGDITVTGSTGATTIALGNGNDTVNTDGYGNSITLGNGNDVVHAGDGASQVTAGNGSDKVTIAGYGNTVTLGDGNDVVTGGDGNNHVGLGNGNDTVTLGGMGNQIAVGSGTNTIMAGSGLASVVAGAGRDTITLAGTGNHVVLNGSQGTVSNQIGLDVLTANGGSDQFHFVGSGNQAIINGQAHVDIVDQSVGLAVSINSSSQVDTITGFGGDALGVVHLMNGVGNYHSVADIVSALHSDGHGGTLLALGTDPAAGSIDFVGTTISQLHASSFMIG